MDFQTIAIAAAVAGISIALWPYLVMMSIQVIYDDRGRRDYVVELEDPTP